MSSGETESQTMTAASPSAPLSYPTAPPSDPSAPLSDPSAPPSDPSAPPSDHPSDPSAPPSNPSAPLSDNSALPSDHSAPPLDSWAVHPPPESEVAFLSDSQPNAPPPSYEEAINPKGLQRFHPAEVSRVARQMSRHLSGNGQQIQGDDDLGDTSDPENVIKFEDDPLCAVLVCCALIIPGTCLISLPIFMVILGSAYYSSMCRDINSPYPTWIIVGGVAGTGTELLSSLVIILSNLLYDEQNVVWQYRIWGALLVFLAPWGCVGCYFLWGLWDEHGFLHWGIGEQIKWKDFKGTSCCHMYYFSLALVVLFLIGFGLGIAYLAVKVFKFLTK